MKTVKNIILKQTVQFNYIGRADGIALQQEIHDWCTNTLLPEIDQQLDLLVPAGEYLVIDKLEIDALINKKDWKQELKFSLMHQFREKIREQKSVHVQTNQPGAGVERRTDDLVLFYLDKGYLPWWSVTIVKKDFAETFNEWLIEDREEDRVRQIVEELKKMDFSKLRQRLVSVMPQNLLFQFAGNLFKNNKQVLTQAENFFKYTLASVGKAKQQVVQQNLASFIFGSLLTRSKVDEDELIQGFIAEIQKQRVLQKVIGRMPDLRETESPVLFSRWMRIIHEADKSKILKSKKAMGDTDKKTEYKKLNKDNMGNENFEDGIFIENAGLVILGPYIPMLFTKLEISTDGTLLNPDLAICLLQYIVTNNDQFREHELVLPKILCGVDLEDLVDTNQKITTAHKKEIEGMLMAVIGHWEAIKDTSIDGFMESFIRRSGKLVFTDNQIQLTVERKAYDILLDRIPWNISTIKLPWMQLLLKTEWT